MDSMTLFFVTGCLSLYLITYFIGKDRFLGELRLLTILLGICSICCVLTDESLQGSAIGLLPIFPVVFVMLHSIVSLIWTR